MVSFHVLGSYLSIALIIYLNAILIVSVESELKLVQVVFRHGDRTPDNNGHEMYPNDPYLNYSFYPGGLGQLTLNGKRREFQLGQILRNRYDNFLGRVYQPKLVTGQSSNYDRTKMSLQLVLAALFPPSPLQQWNLNLNWQPIPTTYIERVKDNLFLADECPLYVAEYNRVVNLPETKEKMSQFKDLKVNLTKLTGKNIGSLLSYFYLYHTLKAESSMNLALPKWTKEYFPDGLLFDGIVATYNISNSTPLLRRLNNGVMIDAMLKNMKAAQNSESDKKIYLYSGHETNIAKMLHTFGVYKPHVPEYSSAVILELHQINNKYYVKLLYYLGIPPIIDELIIKDCKILCPFEDFVNLTRNMIPLEEELDCDKTMTPDYADEEYPSKLHNAIYNIIKHSATNRDQQ